jgi:hypothetical protein
MISAFSYSFSDATEVFVKRFRNSSVDDVPCCWSYLRKNAVRLAKIYSCTPYDLMLGNSFILCHGRSLPFIPLPGQ